MPFGIHATSLSDRLGYMRVPYCCTYTGNSLQHHEAARAALPINRSVLRDTDTAAVTASADDHPAIGGVRPSDCESCPSPILSSSVCE